MSEAQTDTDETDGEGEWDEEWVRICEMPIGANSNFPEFERTVREKMVSLGNRVGRPLVMKVQIQVNSGRLNRSDTTENP